MASTRRTSQRVSLLMLVLVSLTVLTLDYHGEANRAIGHIRHGVQDFFSPIQRGIASALHPVGNLVDGMFHYGSVQGENQALQAEIGKLSRQLNEDAAQERQAATLYSLDNLPFVANIPTVSAEVIAGPTSNFESTIEINQGTSAGVGVGMPVVSSKGLIGKVLSASSSTATVLLINDHRSTIGVRIGQSGVFEATGNGASSALQLSQVGPSATPRRGALALTAGDLAYPPDLPVGTVSAVQTNNGGIFSSASLRPLTNMRTLALVSVMLWLTPA